MDPIYFLFKFFTESKDYLNILGLFVILVILIIDMFNFFTSYCFNRDNNDHLAFTI